MGLISRLAAVATIGFLAAAGSAGAASVEGTWKTESGEQTSSYACGKAICIKILTGAHAGKVIADDLAADGNGGYAGSILNPADGKTYSGTATLSDDTTLKLKGCALKIFCKTQTWTRLK